MTTRRRVLPWTAGAVAAPFVLRAHRVRAAEVTLRLHHFLPPVANAHVNFLVPWAEKVEAESDGALRIRIFPSMQLGGKPPQLYDQARDGVADIVWTLPGYTPGRFRKLEAIELPFVASRSGVTNSKAAQDLAAARTGDELKDVHLVCAWANDHGVIHANRGVHKLEEMQGLKLRFPSRLSGLALEALGAGAVGMPVPQVPESLAQGVIDGAVVPWEVVPALKLQELVRHHTEFPGVPTFYTSMHLLVMNKPRYEGLSDDLRHVLDANSGQTASVMAGASWDTAGREAREMAQAMGNEVFVLFEEETERFQEATRPVVDRWVSGTESGPELLAEVQALIKKYGSA